MTLTHTRPFSMDALTESDWMWALSEAVNALGELAAFPSRRALTHLHACAAQRAGVAPLTFAPYVKRVRKRNAEPIALDSLYDGSIAQRREVPTRDEDWHDLFNALVFVSFPRSKHALHARQFAQLRARVTDGARKLPGTRSREQDALTLFDEGGTLVSGSRTELERLRGLEDDAFYDELRAGLAARSVVVAPFGHALFEHKVAGLRGPSSFAYLLELDPGWLGYTRFGYMRAAVVDGLDRAFSAVLADAARFCSPSELRRLDLCKLTAGGASLVPGT